MSRRAAALAIAAALVVGLGVRLAAWTGTIASDDLTHAWAAQHVWRDPVEHAMPDGPNSPYTVNARRVGVNLPLAAGAAIAGPSEQTFGAVALVESLLGVLTCALWAGALAGRRAAVIAAWLAAVTPVDVWHASIWLQDGLYAAGLAGAMAAAAWAVRRDDPRWWAVTGLVLGYLQYVKESAILVAAALGVAGVVRAARARRGAAPPGSFARPAPTSRASVLAREVTWLAAGFVAMQLLAALYWWHATGDPLHYLRAWLGRQAAVEGEDAARPFPHNLVRLALYVGYHQALGLGLLVAAWFGVRWLRGATPVDAPPDAPVDAPPSSPRDAAPAATAAIDGGRANRRTDADRRDARIRQDVAIVAVLQLLLLLHVLRWGAWTQRYLMQLTPVLVAVGAAGLASAWPAVAARTRTALVAAVIAATALGIFAGQPQHGPWRADVVRRAAAALPSLAPAGTPVYVVLGPRPSHYTDRALALLTRDRTGRFHAVAAPEMVPRGLLVYAHLERHAAPPSPPPGRLVFHTHTAGGGTRQWLSIYAVGL